MLSAVLSRRSAPSALARVRPALPHRTHALARAVRSAGPWRSAASGARVALLSTDAGAPAAAKPCCAAKAAAAAANAASAADTTSAPSHKASNTTVSAAASPKASSEAVSTLSSSNLKFWSDASVWRRAAVNTHCLVGCSIGDLGAVYALSGSTLSMPVVMGIAMASGVTTSLALETLRLRFGRDAFSWSAAASTAARMSLLSMLTMEAAENAVTLWMGSGGGGGMLMGDPSTLQFWVSLSASLSAGFLAPLPYNYYALKRYRRSCH